MKFPDDPRMSPPSLLCAATAAALRPGSSGPRPGDRSQSRGSAPHAIRPSPLSKPADTDPDPGPHLRLGRLRHWPWSRHSEANQVPRQRFCVVTGTTFRSSAPGHASGRRRVVTLALRVDFPPVDVHQARTPRSRAPRTTSKSRTTVAHLQPPDLVDPQAPSVAAIVSSREPPASAAIESSRHTSNQRTFASSHIDSER
jgi:hypothetical protein